MRERKGKELTLVPLILWHLCQCGWGGWWSQNPYKRSPRGILLGTPRAKSMFLHFSSAPEPACWGHLYFLQLWWVLCTNNITLKMYNKLQCFLKIKLDNYCISNHAVIKIPVFIKETQFSLATPGFSSLCAWAVHSSVVCRIHPVLIDNVPPFVSRALLGLHWDIWQITVPPFFLFSAAALFPMLLWDLMAMW